MIEAASGDGGSFVLGELGSILLVLGVVSYFASKFKFSVVPIFLLGGLFFGEGGVVALSFSEEFLELGARIGGILLLLLLGLEYTADELLESVKRRRSAGFIDFGFGFIPGFVVAIALDWGVVGGLLLGGVSYVSSSGIATQFIRDGNLKGTVSSKIAVGILVVEDVVLAGYLPVVAAVSAGFGLVNGLISFAVALCILGGALVLAARGIHIKKSSLWFEDSMSLVLAVFGGALLAAGMAELVGFSGAVAAFLVGLMLTGDFAELARVRLAPLRDLFAAIFFLFFGLSINPSDLGGMVGAALVLLITSLAGKWVVAWWVGREVGEEGSVARVFLLLTPRGEFSIIIAALAGGLSFADSLQSITILYVILSSVVGSVLLRFYRVKE